MKAKKYTELSAIEKIQADCDMKATNIIIQGLPTNIYSLVNHHRVAKDLWERVQLLMQGTSLTKQERECKLYDAFNKFAHIKGESLHQYYLRFTQLINDMNIYNMKLEQFQLNTKFLNSLPPEWSKFVTDLKLVKDLHTTNFDQLHVYLQQHEIHANEVRLMREHNQDPFALVACPQPPSVPQIEYTVSTVNQQTHLAEFPQMDSGLAVLMFKQGDDPIDAINKMMSFGRQSSFAASTSETRANISGTGGNNSGQQRVVKCFNCQGGGHMARQCPKPKRKRDATWFRDKVLLVEAQGSGKVLNKEELEFLADPGVAEAKAFLMANLSGYGSDVLSEYLLETQNAAVQDINSFAQQDAMTLSVFEQLSNQFADFEKEINYLKQTLSEQSKGKELLTKTFNVFKNESKEKENKNIDKEIALEKKVKELDNIVCKIVITKETNVISIADSEETLMLEEESRSKMLLKQNFGKRFIPQQELSDEQAFQLQTLHHNTDQSASSPVKIEAPRELPKVSLVKTSLKKLKYHLGQFDNVVKKQTTPDALTEREWGFEHTKAVFVKEIIPFVKTLKDIFNVFL
ncbi:copia protein [Tanacetum coccineum]